MSSRRSLICKRIQNTVHPYFIENLIIIFHKLFPFQPPFFNIWESSYSVKYILVPELLTHHFSFNQYFLPNEQNCAVQKIFYFLMIWSLDIEQWHTICIDADEKWMRLIIITFSQNLHRRFITKFRAFEWEYENWILYFYFM